MAQPTRLLERTVLEARYKIFNHLCIAYRRSGQNRVFRVRAEEVRIELAIPENIFAEALTGFIDASNESIVEVFEQNGERYLRLGETAIFNLTD